MYLPVMYLRVNESYIGEDESLVYANGRYLGLFMLMSVTLVCLC